MMKALTMNSVKPVFGLVLVLVNVCTKVGGDHTKTYSHTLPSGEKITCYKCEPGEYLIRDCSRDGEKSDCEICPMGQYNTHYTIAKSCAVCDTQCRDPVREQVNQTCTSQSNISCICKDGFYRVNTWPLLCTSHDECPPEKGVKKIGNPYKNTECEKCLEGYYSGVASKTEGCKQCTKCSANETVLQECTSTNDTICTPKEKEKPEEKNTGWIIAVCVGLAVLSIVGAIVCFICCRKRGKECIKKNSKHCTSDSGHDDAEQPRENDKDQEMNPLMNGRQTNGVVPHDSSEICGGEQYLNTKELDILSGDLISTEYQAFFRLLYDGDADGYIAEMVLDYDKNGVREVIYRLLKKWQLTDKEKATKAKVLKTLEEKGWIHIEKKYREKWSMCEVSQTSEDTIMEENHS